MVFVDIQHMGKKGRQSIRDRGAWGDLNGDGSRQYEELEVHFTAILGIKLMGALYAANYPSIMLTDGRYQARHHRAGRYSNGQKSLYLALHFNAATGPEVTRRSGKYGSVFFDHRSSPHNGPKIAGLIADELLVHLPELSTAKARPASPDDWTRRAYSCISGLGNNIIGLLLEPAFLDQLDHAPIFDSTGDGMDRIVSAVMAAINQYNQ